MFGNIARRGFITQLIHCNKGNNINSSIGGYITLSSSFYRTMSTSNSSNDGCCSTPHDNNNNNNNNSNNNVNNNNGGKKQQYKKPPQQQPPKPKGSKPSIHNKPPMQSKYNYTTPAVIPMDDDVKYIDTHAHVDMYLVRENRPLTDCPILFAKEYPKQFEGCVQVCCDPVTMDYTDFLVENNPQIYAAYGVHPHNAKDYTEVIEKKLIERMAHPRTVAWGEMGLDYHYNNSTRDQQLQAFRKQLLQAVKLNKPLVIHSREAEKDTVELLKELVPPTHRIHIHCCTSVDNQYIKELLEGWENLCIGFTGCISFKSSEAIRDTLASIPLDRILLETDMPYMGPEPFRGKLANSSHIPHVANIIAQVKKVPLRTVFDQCRLNTNRIYGI